MWKCSRSIESPIQKRAGRQCPGYITCDENMSKSRKHRSEQGHNKILRIIFAGSLTLPPCDREPGYFGLGLPLIGPTTGLVGRPWGASPPVEAVASCDLVRG